MSTIKSFFFNPFQENTYIISDATGECIIIDPGCFDGTEQNELAAYISSNKLKPVKLVLTHAHIDHVLGNKFVCDTYGVDIYMNRNELNVLHYSPVVAQTYGIPYELSPEPKHFLEQDDMLSFGETSFKVLFVPGHSPGSIAFYNEKEAYVINGDVLFQRSIGRTDLPGGDFDTLAKSIREQLFKLPDEVVVYSGHGPATTIGEEKRLNPFVGERAMV